MAFAGLIFQKTLFIVSCEKGWHIVHLGFQPVVKALTTWRGTRSRNSSISWIYPSNLLTWDRQLSFYHEKRNTDLMNIWLVQWPCLPFECSALKGCDCVLLQRLIRYPPTEPGKTFFRHVLGSCMSSTL